MTDRERIDQYLAAARHLKNPQSRQHVAIVRAALAIIDKRHRESLGYCSCYGGFWPEGPLPCESKAEDEQQLWLAINGR